MIFFIDVVGPVRPDNEPEILSRIIDHEPGPEDALEKAKILLSGVHFAGARAVRVLDHDGREIFFHKVDGR
jgi:hypothetical protein